MKIKDLKHLKELCKDKSQLDCFVALNGCRSSKTLMIDSDKKGLVVYNEIDDTSEGFDSFEDMAKRHLTINEALEKGAFYVYDYEISEIAEMG